MSFTNQTPEDSKTAISRRSFLKFGLATAAATAAIPGGLILPSAASAAVDTYPYPNHPHNDWSSRGIDPWNFYYRQCTSYVAWKINEAGFADKFTNQTLSLIHI